MVYYMVTVVILPNKFILGLKQTHGRVLQIKYTHTASLYTRLRVSNARLPVLTRGCAVYRAAAPLILTLLKMDCIVKYK